MDIDQWIICGETGVSSLTMWASIKKLTFDSNERLDIPWDADDFGRCYKFWNILTMGERLVMLKNIVVIAPRWKPFVNNWDKLISLYEISIVDRDFTTFNTLLDSIIEELQNPDTDAHTPQGVGDSVEDGEYKATEYPTCPECHSTRVFMDNYIRYCWDCYQDGRKMVAVIDPISKTKPSAPEQVTIPGGVEN